MTTYVSNDFNTNMLKSGIAEVHVESIENQSISELAEGAKHQSPDLKSLVVGDIVLVEKPTYWKVINII